MTLHILLDLRFLIAFHLLSDACKPQRNADIVFIVDASLSESKADKTLINNSIYTFVSKFTKYPVVPDRFQFAFVSFSFKADVRFYLNTYMDNVTLVDGVENVATSIACGGASNVHLAFEMVRNKVLIQGNGAQNSSGKIVILFSDGLFSNPEFAANSARTLERDFNARVYSVATGPHILHRGLLNIASAPSHVSSIHEYDWMHRILQKTMVDCGGKTRTCSQIKTKTKLTYCFVTGYYNIV